MTRRATYAPSLFSVETTRTAPPPYETSSLFNADVPEFLQYRDLVLALESPQLSALASSSFHNEELRASSSQRAEEGITPPAQPEIERHESSTALRLSEPEPTQSAFRSPNPLRFIKPPRRIEVPLDEGPLTLSAPSRPVPVAAPTPATPLASEHFSSTLPRSRSRRESTPSTHREEGLHLTRRDRRRSAPAPENPGEDDG